MVSAAQGYGIASGNGAGQNWYYLVETSNAATSWNVREALPLSSFRNDSNYSQGPLLHFVNRKIGYVSNYHGPLYVTVNAGATWSKVLTPGIWPSFVTAGSTVSVVSDVCKGPLPQYGALKCPSDLSMYRLGAIKPLHSFVIPSEGVGSWRSAVAMTAISAMSTVVVEGNNEGAASSLLETDNAGVSWHRLADPCEGLIINQLITSVQGRWLLYCFMDGGMNQGTNGLYSSSDVGVSWSVVSKGTEQGNVVGNIGDFMMNLAVSTNQKIIFAGLDSPAGGIEYSTNGGAHWIRVNQPVSSGGSPELISTFGTKGAVLDVGDGAQYRTLNGTTWRVLSPLSAGKYRGLRICTVARGTKATIGATQPGIPGTTSNIGVIFRNEGSASCYLDGQPNFTAEEGAARGPVGAPTQPNFSGESPYVILKAHGGAATVWFEVQSVKRYPKSFCKPQSFDKFSIQFAFPSTFFLTTKSFLACAGVSTLTTSTVTSGVDTYR